MKSFLIALWMTLPVIAATNTATAVGYIGTTLQANPLRIGVDVAPLAFYGPGNIEKNLLLGVGGFEGSIKHQIVRLSTGTSTLAAANGNWIYDSVPSNFWAGGTYRFFAGTSQNLGCTGTISGNTAPNYPNSGATFTFGSPSNCGGHLAAIQNGDYVDIRKSTAYPNIAGGGGSWQVGGNGSFTLETTDLHPGTAGHSAGVLTIPAGGYSSITTYQDGQPSGNPPRNFLSLNGTFTWTGWLKQKAGSSKFTGTITRGGGGFSCTGSPTITTAWAQYSFPCAIEEGASAPVAQTISLSFSGSSSAASTIYVDDFTFQQNIVDTTNTSVYSDAAVATLRALNPGILRFWNGQLGETFANWITPDLGRSGSDYGVGGYPAANGSSASSIQQGFWEDLGLCEVINTSNPGTACDIVFPIGFTQAEAVEMQQFAMGSTSTQGGALRAGAPYNHPTPYSSTIAHLYLEFGNEPWNGTFLGGSMDNGGTDSYGYQRYGQAAQATLSAMKADSSYNPAFVSYVTGCQCVPYNNGGCADVQNNSTSHDFIGVSNYITNYSGSPYASMDTLAHEWFPDLAAANGESHDPANGIFLSNWNGIKSSAYPKPGVFVYEFNANSSSYGAPATEQQIQNHLVAAEQGVLQISEAMERLKTFNAPQDFFTLGQYDFGYNGIDEGLWGIVNDLGGPVAFALGQPYAPRPQALAMILANSAIIGPEFRVSLNGIPTYSVNPSNGQPAASHIPDSFCYGFKGPANNPNARSLLCLNPDPSNSLRITLTGDATPTGSTTVRAMTWNGNVDANNEITASTILIATSTENAPTTLTLVPGGITALSWIQ